MVTIQKTRKTDVKTITMCKGKYEVLERNAAGKVVKIKWTPILQNDKEDKDGKPIGKWHPITIKVPIEEQFNNNKGYLYYQNRGFKRLDEAEDKLIQMGILTEKDRLQVHDRPKEVLSVPEEVVDKTSGGKAFTPKASGDEAAEQPAPAIKPKKRGRKPKKETIEEV